MKDPRRCLPAVHTVLEQPELAPWMERLGREVIVAHVRRTLDALRSSSESSPIPDAGALARKLATTLSADSPALRPVINATGILIHTGLGRSPLGNAIAQQVAAIAAGYCSLEFDLETGARGKRSAHVASLLRDLTGAEAAAIVNNNAAATLITMKVLGNGREVVVSRGQLVEIGGSYRLPEVLKASGARLREVGTTNKTRLADYAHAIGPETAGLLRVHPSNYRIVGFTEETSIASMAGLAREHGLWCVDDIGSGALSPGLPPGIDREPTIRDSLSAGADLVLCSGDKLLGGPQCGLILGRASLVEQIITDPLMRALRVDKMTLAALETLLRTARSTSAAAKSIPLWALIQEPVAILRERAEALAAHWLGLGALAEAVASEAYLGGGSTPTQTLPSYAVRLSPPFPGRNATAETLARALRLDATPIVGRVHDGSLWFDLRTVFDGQDEILARAVSLQLLDERRPHDATHDNS